MDAGYLCQIATRWRGREPSLVLVERLADADRRLTVADLRAEFSEPVAAPNDKEPARRPDLPGAALIEQRIVQAEHTRRHGFEAETRKARMEEASARLKISPVYFATALGHAHVAVGRAL